MVSRDRRDQLVYSATKSKEIRNKILERVSTKDSGKSYWQFIKIVGGIANYVFNAPMQC